MWITANISLLLNVQLPDLCTASEMTLPLLQQTMRKTRLHHVFCVFKSYNC